MYGWNPMHTPVSHAGNVGGDVLPDEFGTEPLVGYRGWLVVSAGEGGGYALKSLHVSYIWEPQIQAICHQPGLIFTGGAHAGKVSPDPDCSCGIYAQLPEQPLSEWDSAKRGKVSASGTIAMWGRIIQCERGYKAQFAEIQAPLVLDLSCVAGCGEPPVRVGLPNGPQMVFSAFCAEHEATAEQSVTMPAAIWLPEAKEQLSRRYGLEFLSWV